MQFPDTLPNTVVLGATGRIGQLLQRSWGPTIARGALRWQGRRRRGLVASQDAVILDPLADPKALTTAVAGRQILCLAGGIPGRGDLADNWKLAESALRAATPGQRVILCSSAAVYGNQPGLLSETAPLHPANDYGIAKVEMEQRSAVLALDLGVSLCLLRIGNIAGLDAILGGWRSGFQLDQFSDGRTPARSYIGPVTLARLLAELLAVPQLPGVLNIAQPGEVQMGMLLDAAGLHWRARAAPETVISQVALDTKLVQELVRLPVADVGQMVQESRLLEPHTTGGQGIHDLA